MYQMKTNIIIAAACILFILRGCKEETMALTGISVSPKSVSLVFGGTPASQQITATPIPENATGFTFTWTSDKEEVATVSPQGLVTATGPGATEVAVKSGNWVRKVPVTVTEPEEAGVLQGADTWAATDALGRKLPGYDAAGPPRNKYVGLFYWTWHNSFAYAPPYNVQDILARYPNAINDYYSSAWPADASYYFWGEPLFGYYRNTDRWVLRKHAEMLADAGVDVLFFDCTNGSFTWKESYMELCSVFAEARADGVKTPQIAFMLAFDHTEGSREAITEIYNDLYRPGVYSDLFFQWKGKPLIMAYYEGVPAEISNYFTFRAGQPLYNTGATRHDHWGWLQIYPQHTFPSTGVEQTTVSVAQNWSADRGLTAMNAPGVFGRSYTNQSGHNTTAGAVNYGYNFQEQWERALQLDPEFIFITGWNEWVAGRQAEWGGITNAFPDQFSQECSRDIEPMKGGHGDNYYYQMAANIRRFKGVQAPLTPPGKKTIVIDGSFDDWNSVTPGYAAYGGNALHRNSPGWQGVHYANATGRNDFVSAKVVADDQYLYFYVRTAQAITPSSGSGWMRLFIDTDRNRATGWEGYDFVVNRVSPGATATVEKSTGGWKWEKAGEADYKVSANRLEIRIARSVLNLPGKIGMEFKWSDNMQHDGDIMDFYLHGDVAPGGRFNYVYQEE